MRHLQLSLTLATALFNAACLGPPRAGSPLAEAAGRNDVAAMKQLLGGAPIGPGDNPHWVLVWAARNGAADAIAFLVASGVDVNELDRGNNHWTPLQHAVHKGRYVAVRALLEQGAEPDLTAPGRPTPLFMAADSPNPAIVEALLEAGADPGAPEPGGRTALTQAVSGGAFWDLTDRPLLGGCRTATVRAFLTHDRSLRVPDTPAGRQAIGWARAHDCADVLALIDVSPNAPGQDVVATVGLIREMLGVPRPRDWFRRTPATDAPSRP